MSAFLGCSLPATSEERAGERDRDGEGDGDLVREQEPALTARAVPEPEPEPSDLTVWSAEGVQSVSSFVVLVAECAATMSERRRQTLRRCGQRAIPSSWIGCRVWSVGVREQQQQGKRSP